MAKSKRIATSLWSLMMCVFGWSVCSTPVFGASPIDEDGQLTGADYVSSKLQSGGVFRFITQRDPSVSRSMTDPESENADVAHKMLSRTTVSDDQSQWWLLQPVSGGTYVMRNYKTGLYAQAKSGTSTRYTTGENRSTLYARVSTKADETKPFVTISSNSGFSGNSCMHDDAYHNVVNWSASTDASDWRMEEIDIDAETVKDHFMTLSRHTRPANGKVVQIRNVSTGMLICESGAGKLFAIDASEGDYSQYWEMIANGSNQYSFRNVQTGHYFTYVSGTSNTNVQTATSTPSYYVLNETSDAWERTYHISSTKATNQYYTHATAGKGPYDVPDNNVYNITTDDARTHWQFVEAELDEEEISRAQESYQTFLNLSINLSTYSSKMTLYFKDSSCSELKDNYQNMTDDALSADMKTNGLPSYLISIALKIKNNSWSEEDEMSEHFRVAKYKPYSHYLKAKDRMGMGYGFGRLSNPTGVVVKSGDFVTIFCDQAAPQGTTLQLEAVENTDAYGQTYTLSKGMNVFSFSSDASLYIFYQIEDQTVKTPLSNFPEVGVHIEGGRLNGYYDKTRGHDNATWQHLREHLLQESRFISIKTPNFVLCFDCQRVKAGCPTDMVRTLNAWDNMAKWENDLMGYNDTWIPNISQEQRNIYNFFSKDVYMGGSMMTAIYGVQTLSGNVNGHMSYEQMESDGVWGPAHENGHLRQNLIYTVGSLESSCNLFAEVVSYHLGRSAQRAAFSSAIFKKYAEKKPWIDYQGGEITRMLYQLYLYFHVAGHDPDFYPKVFNKLRETPMDHSNRSDIHGGAEYLRMARIMCDVADADLSDFFEAYGFFIPFTTRSISENGSIWKISTTQSEIDEARAAMQAHSKKLSNIIFIEDRVDPVPATYPDAPADAIKSRYDRAQAGDVGQYTQYAPGVKVNLPNSYSYSLSSEGTLSVSGTGATGLVGIKVYDASNQLVLLSNFLNFTLPENLKGTQYTVKAAMSDGTDRVLQERDPEETPEPDPEPDPDPDPEPTPEEEIIYAPVPVTTLEEGYYIIDACDQQNLSNHHFLGADANESLAITNNMSLSGCDNYVWYVLESYNENGKYHFVNTGTGKMLQIGNGVTLVDGEEMPEIVVDFAESGEPFAALGNGSTRFDCGNAGDKLITWDGDISGSRRMRLYKVLSKDQSAVYKLKNKKKESNAYYNASAPDNLAQGTTDAEQNLKFVVTSCNDGYFNLYLPAVQKYVYAINTDNVDANVGVCSLAEEETGSEDKYLWNIVPNTAGYFNIIPKGGSNGWNCRGSVSGVNVIGQWSSNNSDDNRWAFELTTMDESEPEPEPEPEDVYYAVTYRFTNSELGDVYTEPMTVKEGSDYPVTDLPYGVVVNFPEGQVSQSGIVPLQYHLIDDYPFRYYNDVESLEDVRTWYKLKVNNKWVGTQEQQSEEEEYPVFVRDVWSDAHPSHFAFMGNPWGFTIYDYEMEGWLGAENETLSSEEPAIVVYDPDEALEFVFENNDEHQVFRVKKTTNGYLNNLQGNKSHQLGYWLHANARTDGGSTFQISRYSMYSIGELARYIQWMKEGILGLDDVMEYKQLLLSE